MVGKRRARFNTATGLPSKNSRGFAKSGGRGGIAQDRKQIGSVENPAGNRSFGRSGGKGGGSFKRGSDLPRARRPLPTNPHDPMSKDPFMRAGIGLGRNKTKIFKRAGMSMDGMR